MQRLKDAGESLQAASPEELKECLERGHEEELEAQNVVTAARRQLQERTQDIRSQQNGKGKGKNDDPNEAKSNTEIQRAKVRINSMEAELAKYRQMTNQLEEKLKVDKSLADITVSVHEAEEEIGRLLEASDSWALESPPPEEDESAMKALQSKVSPTVLQVNQKINQAHGLEQKELRALSARLTTAQGKLHRIKDKASNIKKAEAMRAIKDVGALVQKAETRATELSNQNSGVSKLPLDRLEESHKEASDAVALIVDAQRQLASSLGPKPLLEAKVEVARLQLRCKAAERKARAVFDSYNRRMLQVSASATDQVLSALRAVARREDGTYDVDALCAELILIGDVVTEVHITDYMLKARPDVSEEVAKFAMRRLAPHGLTKQGLAGLLEVFCA